MPDDDLILVPPKPDEPPPPLRPVRIRSGQRAPQIDPSAEYLLLTGGGPYRLQVRGSAAHPLQVRGGSAPCTGGESGLEFLDGCEWVRVMGVQATGSGHGIRFRGCRNFVVEDCRAWANEIEGFVWGACHEFAVIRCVSERNGTVGRHAPDMCHGFYPGYHSSGLRFSLCQATGNRGLGWHCNGTVGDGPEVPLSSLSLVGCVMRGNGSGGSGNIDLNYARGVTLAGCLVAGGNGLLATWADGSGSPKHGAKGVLVERCTLYQDNPRANHGVRLEVGGVVEVRASIVAGPVSADRTSRITFDALTKRGSVTEARAWVGEDLRSLLPGIGWPG